MRKVAVVLAGVFFAAALLAVAPIAAHHLLPLSWTGEAARLAEVIGAREGSRIAEIGAGSGAMAAEIAKRVGVTGTLFVTEISAARQQELRELAKERNLPQVVVVEAKERSTNLDSDCCTAVYMRNVLHHIGDWPSYARDLRRSVRPGGIVAVIDFAPGSMLHLAGDHGADPDRVVSAFAEAGLLPARRVDNWGGRTYLIAFKRPQ